MSLVIVIKLVDILKNILHSKYVFIDLSIQQCLFIYIY